MFAASSVIPTLTSVADAVFELLSNSTFDEVFLYMAIGAPVLCLMWPMVSCLFCGCKCCGGGAVAADIEMAPLNIQKAQKPGSGPLDKMAADSSQPAYLQKMLKATAQQLNEGFVRLRAEAASDHRQQLDRDMAKLMKRLDEQDKKLDRLLSQQGSSGGSSKGSPALASSSGSPKTGAVPSLSKSLPGPSPLPPPAAPALSQSQSLPAAATPKGNGAPAGSSSSRPASGGGSARTPKGSAASPLGGMSKGQKPTGASSHRASSSPGGNLGPAA